MKVIAAPLAVVLATVVLSSSPVDAQVRVRGGVRVGTPRARAVVVVGGARRPYYRPFYDPFYFDSFYRPYYRPFYWYPAAAYGQYGYEPEASVRLQVTPRTAEVYIDNYYAGTVDDFDGVFQRLHIEPGAHDLTLYQDGYRTVHQQIYVQTTDTFRVRYNMQPLGAGEVAQPRPTEPPPPAVQPQAGPTDDPFQRGPGYRPAQPVNPPPRPVGRPQGPPPPPPLRGDRSDAGTLSVRVQPANAEVFIDGERWDGPSGDERLIVQVSPGLHHVEVRHEGYRNYLTDIEVRPGNTATVNVSLSRQ